MNNNKKQPRKAPLNVLNVVQYVKTSNSLGTANCGHRRRAPLFPDLKDFLPHRTLNYTYVGINPSKLKLRSTKPKNSQLFYPDQHFGF